MTAASPASAPLVLATTDLDVLLAGIGIRVEAAASRYQDTTEVEAATLSTDRSTLTFAAARLAVERRLQASPCGGIEVRLRFRVDEGSVSAASCAIDFTCERWSTGHYVLMPAAVYNGNRYGRAPTTGLKLRDPRWRGHDLITVSPVPRLHPEGEPEGPSEPNRWGAGFPGGSSRIQLLTGDLATPLLAVHLGDLGKSLFLSTDQMTTLGQTGLVVSESPDRRSARLRVAAPGVREGKRHMGRPSYDRGADLKAGDVVDLRVVVHVVPAKDLGAFFERFFALRRELAGRPRERQDVPFAAAWRLQEGKYNRENWVEKEGYYSVGMREVPSQDWQTGWVGGPNAAYALLVDGDARTAERALRVWDFIADQAVTPSGFVKGCYSKGTWQGDTSVCYLRYSADTLYFLAKTLLLLAKRPPHTVIKESWIRLARGLCDGFVAQFEREGRFVHYVDANDGSTVVGGSCAAALAPAALALCARYFNEPHYLDVAQGAAQVYVDQFLAKGITNGGPGDIFQCIDSESAAALLDSLATLWEETADARWLDAGVAMAHLASSWVMTYDFAFPPGSTFHRLDMLTTGTVWANIQNKHSAPGICTLSGDALLKLARGSGDQRLLDLLRDIAHAIPQFLSRADRPITDRRPGQRWPVMPEGWMNERVNTSDWEVRNDPANEIGVGEIFGGSCWCEATMLLTAVEVPGIYLRTDTLACTVIDHVTVQIEAVTGDSLVLAVTNPTRFDARVRLLAESGEACARPLGPITVCDLPRLVIPAGRSERFTVRR